MSSEQQEEDAGPHDHSMSIAGSKFKIKPSPNLRTLYQPFVSLEDLEKLLKETFPTCICDDDVYSSIKNDTFVYDLDMS